MKNKCITSVIIFVVLMGAYITGAPTLINFQGRLTNPTTGAPVADGSHNMTFRLYDAESAGSVVWGPESHTGANAVPVKNGVFNVHLGKFTPLTPFVFSSDNRFLSIQVGTDAEMSPRQRLVSVGYALQADTLKPGATIQGALNVSGEVKIGEGTIFITPSGAMAQGLENSVTISQPDGQLPPQIRTSAVGVANTSNVAATGGTQLTINAGAGGDLNLNTISTATVRIGSGATGQTVILQTTSSVNGNLTVNGRLFGDGSGLTGITGGGAIPIGGILPYAGDTPPPGFFLCDGTIRPISDSMALGNLLLNKYGGDGTTTFGVPDLRGRFPLGADNMGGMSANRVTATQADNLGQGAGHEGIPFHNHGVSDPGHTHQVQGFSDEFTRGSPVLQAEAKITNFRPMIETSSSGTRISIAGSGNPNSINNVPPYQTVNYIIKH